MIIQNFTFCLFKIKNAKNFGLSDKQNHLIFNFTIITNLCLKSC